MAAKWKPGSLIALCSYTLENRFKAKLLSLDYKDTLLFSVFISSMFSFYQVKFKTHFTEWSFKYILLVLNLLLVLLDSYTDIGSRTTQTLMLCS